MEAKNVLKCGNLEPGVWRGELGYRRFAGTLRRLTGHLLTLIGHSKWLCKILFLSHLLAL
jgi:hypothetical protein